MGRDTRKCIFSITASAEEGDRGYGVRTLDNSDYCWIIQYISFTAASEELTSLADTILSPSRVNCQRLEMRILLFYVCLKSGTHYSKNTKNLKQEI